jgi:hypothetical protein
VGGNSPIPPRLLGIREFIELPAGVYGSARASELATVDRRYQNNALIIADLSNDPTYAEVLRGTFGRRVIGLQITRFGDGLELELRPVRGDVIPVYTIGRTHLIELYHSELQSDVVRIVDGHMARKAYEQLANLEVEYRETGVIYTCPPGQHDDLGISCAMLAWAARHPHLPCWMSASAPRPRPVKRAPPCSPLGWT